VSHSILADRLPSPPTEGLCTKNRRCDSGRPNSRQLAKGGQLGIKINSPQFEQLDGSDIQLAKRPHATQIAPTSPSAIILRKAYGGRAARPLDCQDREEHPGSMLRNCANYRFSFQWADPYFSAARAAVRSISADVQFAGVNCHPVAAANPVRSVCIRRLGLSAKATNSRKPGKAGV
jgi:hypothetical protein